MSVTAPSPEIDSCESLFVCEILEIAPQTLHLQIEEGRSAEETETVDIGGTKITGVHRVLPTGRIFEVTWKHYIAYCIRNELYAEATKDEVIAAGKMFRLYSKSRFLDYISRATFATSEYPGPFQHYGVVSENHIIDVVSVDPPDIREKLRSISSPTEGHRAPRSFSK
jgi:hypothetical protein